jgi:hypothetical protein
MAADRYNYDTFPPEDDVEAFQRWPEVCKVGSRAPDPEAVRPHSPGADRGTGRVGCQSHAAWSMPLDWTPSSGHWPVMTSPSSTWRRFRTLASLSSTSPASRDWRMPTVLTGGRQAAQRFVERGQLIRLVSSLGGVATTANHPASTSHRDLSPDQQRAGGIHQGLLRLSVGLEDPGDILTDLERALSGPAGTEQESVHWKKK